MRRRRLALAAGAVAAAGAAATVVAALAWRDLSAARANVTEARAALSTVSTDPATLASAQGRADALSRVDHAIGELVDADSRLRRSASLSILGAVPGLRTQRRGVLALVADSRAAATAGRRLLVTVDTVVAVATLRQGQIPLDKLAQLQGPVRGAATDIGRLDRSPSGLWVPLATDRRRFDDLVRRTRVRLVGAADSLVVSQGFLGASGPRRYLVAFENNAEMRDQGMALSYALIRLVNGRLSFEHSGGITDLNLSRPVAMPIPAGTAAVFGSTLPTKLWQSVNATADFGWSGNAMAAMYQQAQGSAVDGVIAIDVPGLADLLRMVGPINVGGLPEPMTDQNAGTLLLHDLYQHPSGDKVAIEREKEVQASTTEAVIGRLSHGEFDAVQLGRVLGDAAAGGHLRLWSRSPAEEQELERVGLAGMPASQDADETFHLAVQNRTATKLDYYVHPEVSQRIQLTPKGDAIIRTTIRVRNDAPVGAPPSEQLGPDNEVTHAPGEYIASVCWWGPAGSAQDDSSPESGLQLTQYLQVVAAGRWTERTITTVVPHAVRGGRLQFRYVPQPRLDPVDLRVALEAPGWHISGGHTQDVKWARTLRLVWSVTR